MKPRAQSPTIPGNPLDRTGTGGIQRRAMADIRRRFAGLLAEVLAIFERIPRYTVNQDATFGRWAYGMTPEQMQATSLALAEALARWLEAGRLPADMHWFTGYQADAAQAGAAQSAANLTRIVPAYAAARNLGQIVTSQPYRTRAALAATRNLDHWTGLSSQAKSELSGIITRAVIDGKNPRSVRKEIMERLGVSETRAYSYAQTEITNTLRDARMAEKQEAEDALGLNLGLLWTSALLPTTRPLHASRNGKVYTDEQVKEFYSRDGNKYRCHCGLTECLLDEDGNPVISDKARETFKRERETWEKTKKPR